MSSDATGRAATPRYLLIDALRGIAALMVVLFHARAGGHIDALAPLMPSPLLWIFEYGETGVSIFFVISGFVIANTLIPHDVSPRSAGLFLLRRSVRLDPPFWASILLVIAFAALAAKVGGEVYTPPSWKDLLVHAAYLPGLLGTPFISVVYWTLCLEIQFYLTFALLMVVVTKLAQRIGKERALDLILWPSVAFANLWALELAPFHVDGLFLGHWYMFLAGVLVWRAAHSAPGSNTAMLGAVLNLCVLSGATIVHRSVPLGVGTVTAALVLFASARGTLRTWLGWQPLQFLGAISYSLYLIHNPLTGAGFRLGYMITGRQSPWLEALWLVAVISGCVFAGWIFHRIVELPSMAFAKRIPGFSRRDAAQPASTSTSAPALLPPT